MKGISNRFRGDLTNFARLLVHYCLADQIGGSLSGKSVQLYGEENSEKANLVNIVVREIQKEGGTVVYRMETDLDKAKRLMKMSPDELTQSPKELLDDLKTVDVFLNILGVGRPNFYQEFGREELLRRRGISEEAIYREVGQIVMRARPWTVALYPTKAGALKNRFLTKHSLADVGAYRKAVMRPCLDVDYREISRKALEAKALFDESEFIAIQTVSPEGKHYELIIGIEGRIGVVDDGHHNMPGGEILTTPGADLVNGEIYLSLTTEFRDQHITGIYLKFHGGKIVEYRAETGNDVLEQIVLEKQRKSDGSYTTKPRMLGEVSLGLNTAVDPRFSRSLYTEKRGGVVVIAPGFAYEQPVPQLTNEPDLNERDRIRQELT